MRSNKDIQISEQKSAGTKKRILYVEDEPDICDLIKFILEDYEVIAVHSLKEALGVIATQEKCLLYLMDFHLPDGTGFDLCRLIKKTDTMTPIIFLTGTSSINHTQTIKMGAQGLIKKNDFDFVEKLQSEVLKFVSTF